MNARERESSIVDGHAIICLWFCCKLLLLAIQLHQHSQSRSQPLRKVNLTWDLVNKIIHRRLSNLIYHFPGLDFILIVFFLMIIDIIINSNHYHFTLVTPIFFQSAATFTLILYLLKYNFNWCLYTDLRRAVNSDKNCTTHLAYTIKCQ